VVLGLGLLPVLPAGVPVLVAALAAPAVLYAEGRRKAHGKGTAGDDMQNDAQNDAQGEDR